LCLFATTTHAGCVDSNGDSVPWWFIYKFPNGYKASYYDEHTKAGMILTTNTDLSTSSNALMQTLNGLNGGSDKEYLMYNDEPPNANKAGANYGHTKGVLSEDFFLLHSTPKFPVPTSGSYSFPSTETIYGQTFLCISIEASSLNTMAGQLLYSTPYLYSNTFSSSTLGSNPNLQAVTSKQWNRSPGTSAAKISVSGTRIVFESLTKNGEWNKDFYEDLVAAHYSAGLVAETWIRGQALGNYCPPKYPFEVVSVTNLVADGGKTTWDSTQDHSKWCVSSTIDDLVCICGINRMLSQRGRGGGGICFMSSDLAQMLRGTIQKHNTCSKSVNTSFAVV